MSEQPKQKRFAPSELPRAQLQPWMPREVDTADASAVRAVYHGSAPDFQQRRAMQFILKVLCGLGTQPFVPGPDGQRATDLALGRLQVGIEIVNLAGLQIRSDGEQP